MVTVAAIYILIVVAVLISIPLHPINSALGKVILFVVAALACFFTAQSQEVFQSKAWGFSMNKPEGWVELNTGYIHENVKEYDFTKEQLDKVFALQNNSIFLLVLSKHDPETYAGVIPTIKINANRTDIVSQKVFLASIKASFEGVLKVFDNAKFDRLPGTVEVNGVPMVHGVISYDLKNDGNIYRARSFVYSVLRKGHFVQFSFTDTGSKEDDCSKLYQELVSSIIFNKK